MYTSNNVHRKVIPHGSDYVQECVSEISQEKMTWEMSPEGVGSLGIYTCAHVPRKVISLGPVSTAKHGQATRGGQAPNTDWRIPETGTGSESEVLKVSPVGAPDSSSEPFPSLVKMIRS